MEEGVIRDSSRGSHARGMTNVERAHNRGGLTHYQHLDAQMRKVPVGAAGTRARIARITGPEKKRRQEPGPAANCE